MLYRSGLFYCAAPLSGAFGGLLAGALGNIEVGGYKRWPWIFFGGLKMSHDFVYLGGNDTDDVNSRGGGDGGVWDRLLLLHA